MKVMKKEKHGQVFEQILLTHVEMCFAVALALTHDQGDAHDLTREVLSEAWQRQDLADEPRHIKSTLLVMMRKHFMENYLQPAHSLRKNPAFMGGI